MQNDPKNYVIKIMNQKSIRFSDEKKIDITNNICASNNQFDQKNIFTIPENPLLSNDQSNKYQSNKSGLNFSIESIHSMNNQLSNDVLFKITLKLALIKVNLPESSLQSLIDCLKEESESMRKLAFFKTYRNQLQSIFEHQRNVLDKAESLTKYLNRYRTNNKQKSRPNHRRRKRIKELNSKSPTTIEKEIDELVDSISKTVIKYFNDRCNFIGTFFDMLFKHETKQNDFTLNGQKLFNMLNSVVKLSKEEQITISFAVNILPSFNHMTIIDKKLALDNFTTFWFNMFLPCFPDIGIHRNEITVIQKPHFVKLIKCNEYPTTARVAPPSVTHNSFYDIESIRDFVDCGSIDNVINTKSDEQFRDQQEQLNIEQLYPTIHIVYKCRDAYHEIIDVFRAVFDTTHDEFNDYSIFWNSLQIARIVLDIPMFMCGNRYL